MRARPLALVAPQPVSAPDPRGEHARRLVAREQVLRALQRQDDRIATGRGVLFALFVLLWIAIVSWKIAPAWTLVYGAQGVVTGRDVRKEVATRLERAGFVTQLDPDGVLAIR